jgi:hypothetical protein
MSNQEILNQLSKIECELYYRYGSHRAEAISDKDLEIVHNLVKNALEEWHRITVLTITE